MKKLIAFVLALGCVLAFAGCTDKTMTFDIGEASKLDVKSPLGEATISDNAFIHSITENINSLEFEKTSATDGKDDYVYLLTWFDAEDKQIASIAITEENGYQIRHNGYYYKAGADLCIDVKSINDRIIKIYSSSLITDVVSVSPATN